MTINAVTSNQQDSQSGLINLSTSANHSEPDKEKEIANTPESEPTSEEEEEMEEKSPKRTIRGHYANYRPELRAQIGKFAVNHSNQETVSYFLKHHKIDLPESTVRNLRDKYLLRSCARDGSSSSVDQMDHGPRGRPIILGKYDDVVKSCILELVESGEKVSSFLVIATAKQVLQQNEPKLLVENGGKVNLNPAWAKSFLRRIGVKLKEGKETRKTKKIKLFIATLLIL